MTRFLLSAALATALLCPPLPLSAQQAGQDATMEAQRLSSTALRRALDLAQRKDWVFAKAEAKAAGPVALDIIEWQRLRGGEGSFDDYRGFVARNPGWPGLDLLRRKGEDRLSEASPADVVAWFGGASPQTGEGLAALIAARLTLGQPDAAARDAEAGWRTLSLTEASQAMLLARYGDILTPFHGARMQEMLDRGTTVQARRMLDLVTPGTRAVAQARIALQLRQDGVDKLITDVPANMAKSPGLARDRAVWRWRNNFEDGAAEIVLERSTDAETLGDPAIWATVRGQLARWYLRKGDPRMAYKLAARHRMDPPGGTWADLEWLAGYSALKLGDAPVALHHFDRLAANVQSPISAARAAYWRGRALEVIGRVADARAAFEDGARWQTAYYGLLSAERVGLPLDPAFGAPAALPDWRTAGFEGDTVYDAAQALHGVGEDDLAGRFLLQFEENQPPERISPLASLAEDWGDANLALVLAKRAADNGQVLVQAYYPLPTLTTHELGVPEELALSIARRESEFDHTVISPVGARGLMQLMPGTAKLMAPVIAEEFDEARLTTDPTYNLRLGGAYLAKLRDEFGASPVLVSSGYNAGPGRPRRWIEEMGDPRLPTVDIVDWVEMIPFTETRNYVMRVAESLPVYRARLGRADTGPIDFSSELRGTQVRDARVTPVPESAHLSPSGP